MPKNLEAQIAEVQNRMNAAIKNGLTKLANSEAKLLQTLIKTKTAKENAPKPFDYAQREKDRKALYAHLQAKLERLGRAERAKADAEKNRIG